LGKSGVPGLDLAAHRGGSGGVDGDIQQALLAGHQRLWLGYFGDGDADAFVLIGPEGLVQRHRSLRRGAAGENEQEHDG